MNEQEALLRRLNFENIIWVVYIAVAAFSIYGDELIKRSVQANDRDADILARKIFIGILTVTTIIYFYFFARNYNDLKKYPNEETYQIRFVGSVLMLVGITCFLYFQLSISTGDSSTSSRRF